MSEARSCRRCEFFYPTDMAGDSPDHGYLGECRLNPPTVIMTEEDGIATVFPEMFDDEWCGKFQERA